MVELQKFPEEGAYPPPFEITSKTQLLREARGATLSINTPLPLAPESAMILVEPFQVNRRTGLAMLEYAQAHNYRLMGDRYIDGWGSDINLYFEGKDESWTSC